MHNRLKIHKALGFDPTRTLVLRRQYQREISKRFRKLKGDVTTSIVNNDAFGLISGIQVLAAAAPGQFAFADNARKVAAFDDWWLHQIDMEVLEVMERNGGGMVVARTPWQDRFIFSAYLKSIERAKIEMRKIGLNVPDIAAEQLAASSIHDDALRALYQRNFTELQGVTQAMSQDILRTLADGLVQGKGARSIAGDLNKRITAFNNRRAVSLARTEIIRAHAEGTLNTYEQFGIQGVSADVEFSTAGDARVCQRCRTLEGQVYTLKKARGIIPVHPQCRCAWLPTNVEQRPTSVIPGFGTIATTAPLVIPIQDNQ